jgi:hypothetical protein
MSTNQAETTETKEITLPEILSLRDKMKAYSTGWAKKLAAKMFPEEEIGVARERVYNIISGSTRSGEIRIAFVHNATELIGEFEKEATSSRKAINKIVKH